MFGLCVRWLLIVIVDMVVLFEYGFVFERIECLVFYWCVFDFGFVCGWVVFGVVFMV